MNEYTDSMLFPVDGDDTTDTVTIVIGGKADDYPRLWQTPNGVVDLTDALLLRKGYQRADAIRLLEQMADYDMARATFQRRIADISQTC